MSICHEVDLVVKLAKDSTAAKVTPSKHSAVQKS